MPVSERDKTIPVRKNNGKFLKQSLIHRQSKAALFDPFLDAFGVGIEAFDGRQSEDILGGGGKLRL